MEALRSPEGEAISWSRPELTCRVVDWVARGDPPRPAGAVDCFEDLMCLVSFVHGDSRSRGTAPEDARVASGLRGIWQSAMRESPTARALAWALIKRDRHGERGAIVVPLGAIQRTSAPLQASFAARRPDARFEMPLLTSALPTPLAAFAQASRQQGAASARMASMVDEARRLGVLDKASFLALEAPAAHARMLLGPWTGLAPWVRKLTLRDLADVRDIPAELAPWIRVLEVRTAPSQEAARTLPPLRHALPNLHKVILLDESRHLVDDATDGLRDFDSFREVSTESCEAFHRHVAGFSTHGRDVFFAMAAVLLDFEENLQALVPRVRRVLLAVLRDDELSDRCRLAATQGGYLEPMQMLETMEQLIQDQSIGSTS